MLSTLPAHWRITPRPNHVQALTFRRSFAGIKEPLFRRTSNGASYYIRIESPSDFVRLYPRDPLLAPVHFPPPSAAARHWLDALNPVQLKAAGDRAFAAKRFVKAKEAYELALDALEPTFGPDSDPTTLDLRTRLYANLAQAFIKLEMWHGAFCAAQGGSQAFSMRPAALAGTFLIEAQSLLLMKIRYRAALADYHRGRYDSAKTTLLQILRAGFAPSDPDPPLLLARVEARLAEIEGGPSVDTTRSLWSDSLDMQERNQRVPASPPDLADWIDYAALSIVPIPGKGNGLVAKRRIRRGELLMCCKPLACAGGFQIGQLRYNAGVNLWTRSEDPWAVGEVVSEVLWRSTHEGGAKIDSPWAVEEVGPLWAGEGVGREHDLAALLLVMDPSRVEGAVTFNGFHVEEVSASALDDSAKRDCNDPDDLFYAPTALYPRYPSALNHSCLSNCTYTFLHSVFFLRARIDIEEGDELVDSYVDASDPLEVRNAKLAAHGFQCACELCAEEREVGEPARERRAQLVKQAETLASPDVDELRRIVEELETTYGQTTTIRPALYTPLRMLSQALSTRAGSSADAIANEVEALRCLGASFAGSGGEERLVTPSRLRDIDAVLSALWIAKEWKRAGRNEASRWVSSLRSDSSTRSYSSCSIESQELDRVGSRNRGWAGWRRAV